MLARISSKIQTGGGRGVKNLACTYYIFVLTSDKTINTKIAGGMNPPLPP